MKRLVHVMACVQPQHEPIRGNSFGTGHFSWNVLRVTVLSNETISSFMASQSSLVTLPSTPLIMNQLDPAFAVEKKVILNMIGVWLLVWPNPTLFVSGTDVGRPVLMLKRMILKNFLKQPPIPSRNQFLFIKTAPAFVWNICHKWPWFSTVFYTAYSVEMWLVCVLNTNLIKYTVLCEPLALALAKFQPNIFNPMNLNKYMA